MSAPVASRSVTGPAAALAWLVAVGWLALAAAVVLTVVAPWNLLGAAVAVVLGVATGWLASSLGVRVDGDGLRIGRAGRLPWDDVTAITLGPGRFVVPQASVRRGRALMDVPLDGLGAPAGLARRLAQRVADAGELGPIGVRTPEARGAARRAVEAGS